MSNSTPTYNIFSTPPILPGEHQTLSHSEHPSLKKQRVCEALVLNPTVPAMSNNVMTPNLVNRQLNGDSGVAKMQLCRMFYYKRKCTYAGRCRFSHVNPEKVEQDLGRFRVKSNRTSSGCSGDHRSGYGQFASKEKSPKSAMWKTKLCKKWEITGGCPYGNTCYFAHGQAELRKVGRHNASASRIMKMNVSNSFSTGNAGPGSGITCKQRLQGEGCAFKWKSLEKINGIYADWIEDTHLFQSSFSK